MSEEMLKKIGRPLGRRGFLKGSALGAAAAGIAVIGAMVPAVAQEKAAQQEEKKPANPDEALFAEEDKNKTVKVDANGREYRACPQCGYNMYRQGRTWTCENCGYSYVE